MWKTILAALMLAATAAGAYAQELTAKQQAEARITLQTARNLALYGEARGDALALVMAARMMAGVPGRVAADSRPLQGRSAGAMSLDVEGLIGRAGEMAKGDPLVLEAIAGLRAAAEDKSRSICHWEYYCYYDGSCEYAYVCR